MENLEYYNKLKSVPEAAQKPIQAGRLKGYTDINPMWRIKVMTEVFGPIGVGWKYTIKRLWTENAGNEEVAAFAEIELHIKHDGEWSESIPGVGGNSLVSKEKNGLYTNDECFKMAVTDALSVALKMLGVGADVYFEKGRSKYTSITDTPVYPEENKPSSESSKSEVSESSKKELSDAQCRRYYALARQVGFAEEELKDLILVTFKKDDVSCITKDEYNKICNNLENFPTETMKSYRNVLAKRNRRKQEVVA